MAYVPVSDLLSGNIKIEVHTDQTSIFINDICFQTIKHNPNESEKTYAFRLNRAVDEAKTMVTYSKSLLETARKLFKEE